MSNPCLTGDCDHSPYDPECADPDYQPQPCCKLIVHVDEIGSDDPDYHDSDCWSFDDDESMDLLHAVRIRAAVARSRR